MEPEELRKQLKKGAIVASFFALGLLFYALGLRAMLVVYILIVGVLAVLAILLQSGRGGGLAASLGGLGADSLLGTHSATPIAKATYVMLGLFVFLAMLSARLGFPEEVEAGLVPSERPAAQVPMPGLGEGPPEEAPVEAAPEEGSATEPGEPPPND